MSLETQIRDLKNLLTHLSHDLEKAENGNKAAAQRVRTGTVKLEKTAKKFRKESIVAEKKGIFDKAKKDAQKKKSASKGKRKSAAKASHSESSVKAKSAKKKTAPKAAAKKHTAPKKKAAPKKAAPKKAASSAKKAAPKKAAARVKTSASKKISRPRSLSLKRPTAKLPQKRLGW